jgi:predicted dinucleotide-utilizing enzyme
MVTYELYYTPEMSKMQKESKLSDIDERIARIEKLIGSSAGQTVEDLVKRKMKNQILNLIFYSLQVSALHLSSILYLN